VQIVGASFDSVKANKSFADKAGFQFPLLCDTERVLGRAYGAGDSGSARRISYLIDETGVITHAFARVDTGSHAQEVLALVQ
jgi:peroxiredoxin Q/BCP